MSSSTPFFLSTVAPDHQQMKFKKLTGTRAHEARVLRGFQRHFNAQNFQTQNLTVSIKLSQTPTLKVSEKKDPLSRTHSQGFSRFLTNSHKHPLSNSHKHPQNSHKHPLSRFLKHSRTKHSLSLTSAARGLSQTLTHAQNTHSHLHRRQGDS